MSWRNKKPDRGYGRFKGRGPRPHRGDEDRQKSSSKMESADDKQEPGQRGDRGYHLGNKRRPHSGQSSYDVKRFRYKVGDRLKEEDVGITEFVNDHKRFVGIIKERFSDFHVHEISCDNQICKLTNQDIPVDTADVRSTTELAESLPTEVREKLEAFTHAKDDAEPTEIDVTEMNKETRKKIHTMAKRLPSVISETKDRDGKKIIVLSRRSNRSSKLREDRREDWSSREGNYCHFLLHKVNMDTMEALGQLASKLRISHSLFQYAGTKDRRAHTTQWVSVKKVNPSSIHAAARHVRGAYVGNFQFSQAPLKLGTLNGNRFRIVLRSVSGTDEEIECAMRSLRDRGFLNYYGLQRFGSIAAIPTHRIGKTLLQGKWREAIDLILKPRVDEQQRDMAKAREIYEKTKDATAALKPIERSAKIEAMLLRGLVQAGENNPQGALDHIPRNARLMYIHSYQSFVWNHMVSKRIKEFGLKPIVGDLVFEKNDTKSSNETMEYSLQNDEAKVEEKTEEHNDDVQPIESTLQEENFIGESKVETENEILDDTKDEFNLPGVKTLTEDDLSRYTLADIVMPKPGWKVLYPVYAKTWYNEFLAKDDLTTDLRQKNKKYSLGGEYRKILETPGELSWKIVRYNGYHDDLTISDVDEMRGLEPPKVEAEGKHKALILEFSLKSSTYATMALREILEIGTSAQAQASRSVANQAQDIANKNLDKIDTEVELVVDDMEVLGEAKNVDDTEVNKTEEPLKSKSDIIENGSSVKKVEETNESTKNVDNDEPKNAECDELQEIVT